jgi:class 3 adenylate cyclase
VVTEQAVPGTTVDAASAQVRTFLIADVRGYTAFMKEHGDEAAGRLANRFAVITKGVAGERDGEVLELRGDEALAVFQSPRQALRAGEIGFAVSNPSPGLCGRESVYKQT